MKKYFLRKNSKAFLALSIVVMFGIQDGKAMNPPANLDYLLKCPEGHDVKHNDSDGSYEAYVGPYTFKSAPHADQSFPKEDLQKAGEAKAGITKSRPKQLYCEYTHPKRPSKTLRLMEGDETLVQKCKLINLAPEGFQCKRGG